MNRKVYRTSLKKPTKKRKKPVAIVLLFEHKKSIRSYFLLFLQLLDYMVLIWKEDWHNKKRPSVIIPIVVYQGKNGLKQRTFHDLFTDVPADLLEYIPNVKFFLTSVHNELDETLLALEQEGLLRSLFLAYTFAERRDQIKGMLLEIFKFFKHDPDKMDFF